MPFCNNVATGIPSGNMKYSKLSSTDDGYIDLQFKRSPPKIRYKAIALAIVLFMIGTFLIVIGALWLAGYISKRGGGRPRHSCLDNWNSGIPARILPLCIAHYASKGYRGYSYDDILDFDD